MVEHVLSPSHVSGAQSGGGGYRIVGGILGEQRDGDLELVVSIFEPARGGVRRNEVVAKVRVPGRKLDRTFKGMDRIDKPPHAPQNQAFGLEDLDAVRGQLPGPVQGGER